ncbi:hypothetical protein QZH41_002631 [Actinostola sp. cb2023]|nr:hypothetical protein QZH41_002631 [Actinostola sp. cb2023]
MAGQSEQERLADGRVLVLKVIGKINLRIERKDYDDLTNIFHQVPGDVLVLIVLKIVSQVRNEFNVSQSDESIISMLERFQRAYGLVHQLLQQAVKGNDKTEDKMSAQKQLKYSTISIKGTTDTLAEPGGSDTDLFDSVTQLDDETDLERISSTLSSTDSEKPRRENKKVKSRKVTKAQLNELEKVRKELAEKEKDLEVAQEKINDMEEKEKEMRNRLADQAHRQLRRGGKYDDLAEVDIRPSTLTENYENLYSQTRIDALDDLDDIEAFERLDDASSIKAKLLFSVIVVSYRTVYRALAERQHRIKRLLDIQGTRNTRHAQGVLDDINVYFRHTASHFNITTIKRVKPGPH